MYKFLLFINKGLYVLLFVIIEVLAINYYSDGSAYNRAKVAGLSEALFGGVRSSVMGMKQFFALNDENRRLTEEVASLRSRLTTYEAAGGEAPADELLDRMKYRYTTAHVVNNSTARSENFFTLDKGTADGVVKDMAVVSAGAIAGYVMYCSENFSVAISLLNVRFRASGKIAGTDFSGSLSWDGHSYEEMVLSEIPKYATVEVGDTIVTTEFSSIFPPGLLIGTVKNFELVNGTYYNARITLFAHMPVLNNVVLVKYEDLEEKTTLEKRTVTQTATN